MNKSILAVALASTVLAGCSSLNPLSNNTVVQQPDSNMTAVKERTVGLEFDEDVKIVYTTFGNLKRIEVLGRAPSWKAQAPVMAEIDAKEKMVRFMYEEDVSSERRVNIVARSLEKATDNAVNRMDGAAVEYSAAELEGEVAQGATPGQDNTSRRLAETVENSTVNVLKTSTASGKLRGFIKTKSYETKAKNGDTYFVVKYEWSEDNVDVANQVRAKMFGN